jgi:hypothetical protein
MGGIPESSHPAQCSPRELWLERRVNELEQELKHRAYEKPLPKYSAYADADEMVIHRDPGFELMVAGEMETRDLELHVRTTLWLDKRRKLQYSYYVSPPMMASLSDAHKTHLMTGHHQRMIFGVGREMWSGAARATSTCIRG